MNKNLGCLSGLTFKMVFPFPLAKSFPCFVVNKHYTDSLRRNSQTEFIIPVLYRFIDKGNNCRVLAMQSGKPLLRVSGSSIRYLVDFTGMITLSNRTFAERNAVLEALDHGLVFCGSSGITVARSPLQSSLIHSSEVNTGSRCPEQKT